MTILKCFQSGVTPRPIQADVLSRLEADWDTTDVFVLQLPTASGKSKIAYTIANWATKQRKLKSCIITPTRILVSQYKEEFPYIHTLLRKDDYQCINTDDALSHSCAVHRQYNESFCGNCPYMNAVRRSHAMPFGVYNYHTYVSHKLQQPVLIVDEAHNLLSMIQEQGIKRLWRKEYHWPSWVTTYKHLHGWLQNHPDRETSPKLQTLYLDLELGKNKYLVEKSLELYRGKEEECLTFTPLYLGDEKPILWPQKKVNKIVLMSATIGPKDVEQLGLSKRRIKYYAAPSPIPAENRPIICDYVGAISYLNQDGLLKKLAEKCIDLLNKEDGKGLIHVPYSLARKIQPLLASHPRILSHEQHNKMDVFNQFRESPPSEGKVLLASGFYEGVDLPFDAGRWQVILKIPFPSLADAAVAYKAQEDPEWYTWETLKPVIQSFGRICRGPTDFGKTFILDRSFDRLYFDGMKYGMIPGWMQEAVFDEVPDGEI